jgi:hypothetical protein
VTLHNHRTQATRFASTSVGLHDKGYCTSSTLRFPVMASQLGRPLPLAPVWRTVRSEQLVIIHLLKFVALIGPEVSVSCSQEAATGCCPEPLESSPQPHILLPNSMIHDNSFIFPSTFRSSKFPSLYVFPLKRNRLKHFSIFSCVPRDHPSHFL